MGVTEILIVHLVKLLTVSQGRGGCGQANQRTKSDNIDVNQD